MHRQDGKTISAIMESVEKMTDEQWNEFVEDMKGNDREVKNMGNKYVTEQEAEKIKMLIARGLTNKEIAIVLQRSPETVRRIRAGVWEKYKEEKREKYNAKKEAVKEHEKTETDELKVTDYLQAMLDKQDKISTQLELIIGMLK